jgi:sulfide dehydrogenase [flavocytochrome c] flavoprotein subunit
MDRRQFIRAGSAASAASVLGLAAGCASTGAGAGGQVVVIGGGYGGATAAKYIRMWSDQGIVEVTLVEPNDSFVSCPISNLVLGGSKQMADITTSYDNLAKRHGVKVVQGRGARWPSTSTSARCAWPAAACCPTTADRVARRRLHVGQPARPEETPARRTGAARLEGRPADGGAAPQLEAMPDGGVYALAIPKAPYRCPPGPYERACQVAHYFSGQARAKVLILDANPTSPPRRRLFKKAWAERYKGIIEYRPKHALTGRRCRHRTRSSSSRRRQGRRAERHAAHARRPTSRAAPGWSPPTSAGATWTG